MKVYNTKTRQKEIFEPMLPPQVKIYCCGPTVYDFFHLGNARPFIVFDTLRRYLTYKGYDVLFCQNFTDIDDRMIAKAKAENMTVAKLADRYIAEYYHDADRLNIMRPTFQPRATETIDEIIYIIKRLAEKGHAYETADGVYFNVASYPTYGEQAGHSLEDLKQGARVEVNEEKRSALDFSLWKKKKDDEPAWPSPWGDGRPGWHIECSAMIYKHLGETIDIHCGGQDLVFPHHENERAQSEAAFEKPFVHYWLHNGFVNVDSEKMSKSTGNFFTVRDIVSHFSYDVLRFFILSVHYRMPINFSTDLLAAATSSLERITNCVEQIIFMLPHAPAPKQKADASLRDAIKDTYQSFTKAMDDDLNTADAIAAIFGLVRQVNTFLSQRNCGRDVLAEAKDAIVALMDLLGITIDLTKDEKRTVPKAVVQLIDQRATAKEKRDFEKADQIRDQIEAMGFQIKDTPDGPQVTPT